ncbi:MAG TPA: alpha-amylase family glycosyl hydrolase [Polyangiaceae bacterium]|nr:alpha-amylase family glycosyl hydrolase [Polyangiaceae bacterium]HQK16895.1 alpha-amylase family glycosyl hydrolase [Polyangiaceae bacterium]
MAHARGKTMKRHNPHLKLSHATPFALALLAVAAGACFDLDDVEGSIQHKTYVQDWRDEVIYQVLVDRFANGDPSNDYGVVPYDPAKYHGGDWKGIEDKLDYIQALGVTTLWISPIVKNVESDAGIDGYHGYWAQDLTKLNPHFGDLAALRSMVDAAHARGLKVILDIVTNHVGQVFFYDINGNGQPDEAVWGGGELIGGRPTTPIQHVTEYDPEYEEPVVMARTSLGEAGPADIIFFRDAATNRMPPVSGYPPNAGYDILQLPQAYNRRGRVWNWGSDHCCYFWLNGKQVPDYCQNDVGTIQCHQVLYGDFPGGLKDVNTEWQEVRDAMFFAYGRWLTLVDFDGFRIDTLKHVEHGFWQDFCPRIRQHAASFGKQQFFMFGESFGGDDRLNGSYTFDNEVDSVFYFSQKYVLDSVFKHGGKTSALKELFDQREANHGTKPHDLGIGLPPTKVLVNFLDNHDVARFLYDKKIGDKGIEALHTALVFLYTEDGIPCLYYGTEQQFEGGNDPNNREDLWNSRYDTSNPTFRFIAELNRIRKRYEPLRRGDLTFVQWNDDSAGILAYERFTSDQRVLIVINTHDSESKETIQTVIDEQTQQPKEQPLPTGFAPGTVLVNVLPDDDPTDELTVAGDSSVRFTVPSRGAKIFVPQNQL